MIIILPAFLVCLVGLVMYLVCVAPKPAEVGRLMFAIGLAIMLFCIRTEAVRLPW